jgi:stage II sporulation protein D
MTPARTVVAGALALALAMVTVGAAAPAYAADDWSVPGSATITIDGRGFGHGHGMSQHGAQGAARQGLAHEQIVEFYYPGTQWGVAKGKVSVLISADTTKDVRVRAADRLRLRVVGTGARTVLAAERPKATHWRAVPVKAGRKSQVWSKVAGRWTKWRTFAGPVEFSTPRRPTTLVLPGGGQAAYRGALRAVRNDTVNVVSLEAYLRGVVPREVPALWEPEAVQAQSVAARTYAAFERAHPLAGHYQICDTTSCQVYGGAGDEHPAATAAIKATTGQILTSGGEPAFTQFSASSGGWTSAGSQPYLVARQDPYDGWSGNPHASWRVRMSDTRIESAFPGIGDLTRIRFSGRDGNGQWGGRVDTVKVTGSNGSRTVSGEDFRFLLGLRSEWIHITVS